MLPLEDILIAKSSLPFSASLSLGSEWLTQLKYYKGLGPTVFSFGQKKCKKGQIITKNQVIWGKPRIMSTVTKGGKTHVKNPLLDRRWNRTPSIFHIYS